MKEALVSGWREIFGRIETTHQPRPPGNVVALPNGLHKLAAAIEQLQREANNATQQRSDYNDAWEAATREFGAAMDKNAVWQRDIATRLYRLRMEWASVSLSLGVQADVPCPPGIVFGQQPEDGA